MSTGNEGGLYAVVTAVAKHEARQYATSEIAVKVAHYRRSLSDEEKDAAPWEYVQKYGHLLPSELTDGRALRIRANFPEVLQRHPHMIRRLQRVGR